MTAASSTVPNALRALPEAVVSMAAALLTLTCAQWLAPGPGSAVLAVVLSLSLARSRLDRDRRGRVEAAIALPLVGLAATGVGWLLLHAPWMGAAAFTLGVASSVWLRQFGELARRASRLIALPLVTVLTVPHLSSAEHGPLPAALVPVLVAFWRWPGYRCWMCWGGASAGLPMSTCSMSLPRHALRPARRASRPPPAWPRRWRWRWHSPSP